MQEWKKEESFGTNKTRKESSRFLLGMKHRNQPVTAGHLWSMTILQRTNVWKLLDGYIQVISEGLVQGRQKRRPRIQLK